MAFVALISNEDGVYNVYRHIRVMNLFFQQIMIFYVSDKKIIIVLHQLALAHLLENLDRKK